MSRSIDNKGGFKSTFAQSETGGGGHEVKKDFTQFKLIDLNEARRQRSINRSLSKGSSTDRFSRPVFQSNQITANIQLMNKNKVVDDKVEQLDSFIKNKKTNIDQPWVMKSSEYTHFDNRDKYKTNENYSSKREDKSSKYIRIDLSKQAHQEQTRDRIMSYTIE